MCHDLLDLQGIKYVREVPNKSGGRPEKKEDILDVHDPIWLELCLAHIADASERLHQKMTNLVSNNKAAQIQYGSRGGEPSAQDLQKMVQALPQYSEQIDKLSLHVEIAGQIYRIVKELGLRDIGQLEQDLVFGDKGIADVISFLNRNKDVTRKNKLRLLMILAAVYPEKFDGENGLNLMKLAQLTEDDMKAMNNLRLLRSPESKKSSSRALSFKFHKHVTRKDRTGAEETTWQLSRFYPTLEEIIEKLSQGELSRDQYPCINDPTATLDETSHPVSVNQVPVPNSWRSKSARTRTAPTWAQPRNADGISRDTLSRRMGRRVFVFIVGGASRSELRVCHKLTDKLQREVVLGSCCLVDPSQFITKLKLLAGT